MRIHDKVGVFQLDIPPSPPPHRGVTLPQDHNGGITPEIKLPAKVGNEPSGGSSFPPDPGSSSDKRSRRATHNRPRTLGLQKPTRGVDDESVHILDIEPTVPHSHGPLADGTTMSIKGRIGAATGTVG